MDSHNALVAPQRRTLVPCFPALILVSLVAGDAACAADRSGVSGEAKPRQARIEVLITIVPEKAIYQRADKIAYEVTIKNITSADIAVCVETWMQPRGFMKLIVEDSGGNRLKEHGGLEVFGEASKENLQVLPPGGVVKGVLDPAALGWTYAFQEGLYTARVEYFCPITEPLTVGAKSVPVESGTLRSRPVSMNIASTR